MGKKFNKTIVTEGLYVTGDGNGGRKVEFISKDRLNHWAEQHQRMVEQGFYVPAPSFHDSSLKPTSMTNVGSKSNIGFWEKLSVGEVEKDGEKVIGLIGTLDVPLEEDAEKIGNNIRQTSIFAEKKFIDGEGNEWDDVLTHIACVNNGIEHNQANFEEERGLSLSMSQRLPVAMSYVEMLEPSNDNSISDGDLFALLEKVAKIFIPRGTPTEEIPKALISALNQKRLSEESSREGGTTSKPPKDSYKHEVPVVMSQNQTGNGTDNKATVPTDTAMSQEFNKLKETNTGILNALASERRSNLSARLEGLHKRGIVGDDQFKVLSEQIAGLDSTAMSFDSSNNLIKSEAEVAINALEQVQIKMPTPGTVEMATEQDGRYVIQQNPTPSGDGSLTPEKRDAVLNSLFNTTG
jgi:hypothetical protein